MNVKKIRQRRQCGCQSRFPGWVTMEAERAEKHKRQSTHASDKLVVGATNKPRQQNVRSQPFSTIPSLPTGTGYMYHIIKTSRRFGGETGGLGTTNVSVTKIQGLVQPVAFLTLTVTQRAGCGCEQKKSFPLACSYTQKTISRKKTPKGKTLRTTELVSLLSAVWKKNASRRRTSKRNSYSNQWGEEVMSWGISSLCTAYA